MDPHNIQARLLELARKDRKLKVFGAAGHSYKLNPPLAVGVIEVFESRHGVSLPKDYRKFLTEIGNGGAGPAYGLFPFGHQDGGDDLRPWEGGYLVGDVGQPFPHKSAWNLGKEFWEQEPLLPEGISEEEEDRLWEEWDKILDANYWTPSLMNGAIPICHLGCCLWQWLVIHGDQRGFVWDDKRADDAGLAPVADANGRQMTFSNWYMAWLCGAEREVA